MGSRDQKQWPFWQQTGAFLSTKVGGNCSFVPPFDLVTIDMNGCVCFSASDLQGLAPFIPFAWVRWKSIRLFVGGCCWFTLLIFSVRHLKFPNMYCCFQESQYKFQIRSIKSTCVNSSSRVLIIFWPNGTLKSWILTSDWQNIHIYSHFLLWNWLSNLQFGGPWEYKLHKRPNFFAALFVGVFARFLCSSSKNAWTLQWDWNVLKTSWKKWPTHIGKEVLWSNEIWNWKNPMFPCTLVQKKDGQKMCFTKLWVEKARCFRCRLFALIQKNG